MVLFFGMGIIGTEFTIIINYYMYNNS